MRLRSMDAHQYPVGKIVNSKNCCRPIYFLSNSLDLNVSFILHAGTWNARF